MYLYYLTIFYFYKKLHRCPSTYRPNCILWLWSSLNTINYKINYLISYYYQDIRDLKY